MFVQKANPGNPVKNLCPFGCADTQLNEHGYCHHLIGWTQDRKTYERRAVRRNGLEITHFRELVTKDMVIVETPRNSDRVYHEEPELLDAPGTNALNKPDPKTGKKPDPEEPQYQGPPLAVGIE